MESKIELIKMSLIDPNPDNDIVFNMDAIEYLANGIKEEGFIGSIEVFQKPDGRYEISAGHRRYKAMELLGETEIPCTIVHSQDNISKAKRLLSSNLKNRILRPMDYARAIRYYKENVIKPQNIKGQTEVMCKEYFNMSIATIKRLETLLKLIPELQNLSDRDGFPYTALSAASTLSEVQQKELYRRIVEISQESEDNGISGLRINQIAESIRIRDNYKKHENGITKKKKELLNEGAGDVIFQKREELPVISSEVETNETNLLVQGHDNEITHGISYQMSTIEYMDPILFVITEQLESLATNNYEVKNQEAIENNLLKINKILEQIKKSIRK